MSLTGAVEAELGSFDWLIGSEATSTAASGPSVGSFWDNFMGSFANYGTDLGAAVQSGLNTAIINLPNLLGRGTTGTSDRAASLSPAVGSGSGNQEPQTSYWDAILKGVVDGFQSTPTGAAVTEQATQNAINSKILAVVKSPLTWLVGGGVIVLLFVLLRRH